MDVQNTQATKDVMSFEPEQYSLINKVQLMLAYSPDAGDLYSRVKSMKFFDPDQRALNAEVQSLNSDDFQMVGQLLNLFRI